MHNGICDLRTKNFIVVDVTYSCDDPLAEVCKDRGGIFGRSNINNRIGEGVVSGLLDISRNASLNSAGECDKAFLEVDRIPERSHSSLDGDAVHLGDVQWNGR